MNQQDQVLVIGLGSTLRGDDALGRIAAQRVRGVVNPRLVKVIDQCGPTPELAAELANASLVVFLDASGDGPPGQVVKRCVSGSDALTYISHRCQPGTLVRLARSLYGRATPAVAITFRAETLDLNDCRLAPAAAAACELIVEETLRLIATHQQNRRGTTA